MPRLTRHASVLLALGCTPLEGRVVHSDAGDAAEVRPTSPMPTDVPAGTLRTRDDRPEVVANAVEHYLFAICKPYHGTTR